ncbi:diaminopimelate dehydrogenase [Microbacterium sp. MPKO10]|uniref:diaminopimelate dehydrogenase n=1 Tax=Microbacterium sp. MPKO10 TaxID=2989818 RepID=UPI00223631CA|nr:diaminopimelate dehydrogenase [Microbacterium sp. MPKO10]MCW4456700.1 diaminopimelate dehydrogenase [Microbacterium sp. MPKO10]
MDTTTPTTETAPAHTPFRVGIVGYGNLGRGVEAAIAKNPDMSLVGIFSRRPPSSIAPLDPAASVFSIDDLAGRENDIDVLILCGGSKSDLPEQGPELAARFNTVDSFDTHARIPEYFEQMDAVARRAQNTALISTGWDPGMFSMNRLFGEALLPDGETYTFWGRGLSQGHSDAVRRVPGVAAGVQYTLPSSDAIDAVRRGTRPELTTREKHTRECFVVLEEGADSEAVREAIVTMPHYFADYDTTVTFVTAEELARDHSAMPHGGFVLRSGRTGDGHSQIIEYSLALESNPEFTASVLVAYARAVHRLSLMKQHGAVTLLDVPPGLLSPKSAAQLRAELL